MPTYEDDPAEYLKRRNEALEQQIGGLQQQLAQQQQHDQLRRTEDDFARGHPDYFKARDYLINDEVDEWQASGRAELHANQIKAAARHNSNLRQALDGLVDQPDIQQSADKQHRQVEDVAAWLLARDNYLNGRQLELGAGAQRTRRNVAEVVYQLAQRRGFKRELNAPDGPLPTNAAAIADLNDEDFEKFLGTNWREKS
jgi:hypothetical protein